MHDVCHLATMQLAKALLLSPSKFSVGAIIIIGNDNEEAFYQQLFCFRIRSAESGALHYLSQWRRNKVLTQFRLKPSRNPGELEN